MTLLFALFACSTPAETPAAGEGHTEAAHGDETHGKPAAVTASTAGWNHYGEPFTEKSAKDCKEVIAAPDASVDKTVRVTGKIDKVCQKAGCWMVVADDDGNYLRVTMKGHGFGVPTDTKTGDATMADIEGKLIAKKLDAATKAHLKSESKGTEAEKDKAFDLTYELVATGVSVKKG